LHFAVERDCGLLTLIGPHVDERILIGELSEGGSKPRAVTRIPRYRDGLEHRQVELMAVSLIISPNRIADADCRESAQFGDLACRNSIAARPDPILQAVDADDPISPTVRTIPYVQRSVEHPHVRHPLAGRAAFDLEDPAARTCHWISTSRR
jgi:hypothetical protein